MIQVVKVADEQYEVTRVSAIYRSAHEYELLGRVTLEGGRYAVDVVEWAADGRRWLRAAPTFLLHTAAVRWLERRKTRAS